jgi:hypothetical protein
MVSVCCWFELIGRQCLVMEACGKRNVSPHGSQEAERERERGIGQDPKIPLKGTFPVA